MAVTNLLVESVLRTKLNAYHDECDAWRADSEQAELVFDFQELLSEGIRLFQAINRFDEETRKGFFEDPESYDEDFDRRVADLYRRLATPFNLIETRLLPWIVSRYGQARGADEFLACCREVRGILMPDELFFADEALAELRDQAIEESRSGDESYNTFTGKK